jgi:hypothetical protein
MLGKLHRKRDLQENQYPAKEKLKLAKLAAG